MLDISSGRLNQNTGRCHFGSSACHLTQNVQFIFLLLGFVPLESRNQIGYLGLSIPLESRNQPLPWNQGDPWYQGHRMDWATTVLVGLFSSLLLLWSILIWACCRWWYSGRRVDKRSLGVQGPVTYRRDLAQPRYQPLANWQWP